MPTDLHIVRTSDFLRLDASGKFDFDQTARVLSDLARACCSKGVHYALLDARDAQGTLTTTELYQLAKVFAESGFKKTDCLAVLHRYGGKLADIFASFADERGMTVRAVESYEEAMDWFSTALPAQ
jgi:hypothetical protein